MEKARVYETCAKDFAMSHKGPIRERSARMVHAHLSLVGETEGQEAKANARQALIHLYRDFLKIDLKDRSEDAVSLKHERFRDQAKEFQAIDSKFGDLVNRMRSEIRQRHYSIRTEQSYLAWVRRFLAFHSGKAPELISAPGVKEYLNYLAETREVAASTQNQALNAPVFLYRHASVAISVHPSRLNHRIAWAKSAFPVPKPRNSGTT